MTDDRQSADEILEHFRIISELVADYAYSFRATADGALVMEWATDSFAHVTGYSKDEINARGWQSIIHPDDLAISLEQLRQLQAGQNSISELRIIRKDGVVRWVRNYARATFDQQGRLLRIYGAAQDITERKQTEAELRQSEERFKLAVSGAPLTLFEQDLQLRYRWLYPNRVEFPEGNLGHSDADLIPAEDAQVLTRLKQEVINRGVPLREEIRATLPAEVRWYDLVIEPKRDSDGNIVGVAGAAFDITDRKQAEVRLQESEERFAKAFNANPDPVTIHRISDGRYIAANDSFLDITGFTREEVVGRTAAELNLVVDDEHREQWGRLLRAQGGFRNLEAVYRTRFGEVRTALMSAEVIEVGGEPCILAVSTDITERKRVEQALRKSRMQLQITLEAARIGICEWSLADNRLAWSKEHFEILGYEPFAFEPLFAHFRERIHPDDIDAVEKELDAARIERRPVQSEYRVLLPSGEMRWALATGRYNYDESGQAVSLNGLIMDISGRRQAEETIRTLLRVSKRLNSTLDVDELLDILVQEAITLVGAESGVAGLYTPQGMVCHRYFQKGAVLPLEYVWPPGHGLPGWLIQHKVPYITNDAMSDSQIVHELCRQFGVWSALSTPVLDARSNLLGFFEIHNKRDGSDFTPSDQEKLLAVSQAAAIAIQNALAYRAVQRAEEERARLLAREQSLRLEAEQANRLKDEFLATISHVLRTPLNAILGWAGMLRDGKLDQPTAARALETIERNGKSQAKIIEDLLDISRIITGKLRLNVQPVELSSVVEAALDVIRPAAVAKEIRLQAAIDPQAGPVSGDPERLQQVVWNLLSNAVKFTPKDGRVRVCVERQNSHVTLTVSDNGKGIDSEFLPFVFDRFRQADAGFTRAHGGLGLGLAIVRHLVELHGGSVNAASEGDGHGATFTINLPLMNVRLARSAAITPAEVEAALPTSSPMDCPPSLTGLRVFIVEDDADSRILLKTMLEKCDAKVCAADSAARALSLLDEWKPDLLISDIEMPGEDGYSLIRKIRSRGKGGRTRLPAIALTAHARAEDRVRALTAGFDAHVAKPVEVTELVTVIFSLARMSGRG
jgi:PAS domain S-box-containing protein